MNIKRGEIYYANLNPVVGSEQGGIRPVLIVQNNMGNKYSPTVICAAITSKINKADIPTHVNICRSLENGLKLDSTILLEQLKTIDKCRIKNRIGKLSQEDLMRTLNAFSISILA